MAQGHFIGTTLIPGVHSLRCAENICNLLLRQIIIFTQSPQSLCKCLHTITPCQSMSIV